MMCVDFAYYSGVYGGKIIPENDFDLLAKKSFSRILQAISEREIPEKFNEKVKDCCCEIAEKIYISDSENAKILSEKIGNYSITYADNSENSAELNKSCKAVIWRYLGNSGLLYRGVD